MSKLTIPIKGMHCKSCEILVEENLKEIPGVRSVQVSLPHARAIVTFEGRMPTQDQIANAVQSAGYSVGTNEKSPWISRDPKDYFRLAFAGGILVLLYFAAQSLGLFDLTVGSKSDSIWVILLVGLVAGFSSCMALIGGLVLALSARHSELHPEATAAQKFRPHLFFNAGRIIGYGVFGGIIGLLGSAFQLSGSMLGVLTILVGVVMIVLGLKLIEIFPALKSATFTLPKSISSMLGIKRETKEYSHRSAFTAGALTFFLPCGFTQAMQLYAISTGSLVQGALVMTMFAIGTAPGLLGIGGLSSIMRGQKARIFFAVAGLAVIALGVFNISSAAKIISWPGSSIVSPQVSGSSTKARTTARVLKTVYTNETDIVPNTFVVKKGEKVRIEVEARETAYGCMSTIGIPGLYNKMQLLEEGKTIVMQFTPTRTGTYRITCAMGVPRGIIRVE